MLTRVILIFLSLIIFSQKSNSRSVQVSDSVYIVDLLSKKYFLGRSYKKLPSFVREYLNNRSSSKFKVYKKKFNGSDVYKSGKHSRKIFYIATSSDTFIISYKHGGKAIHNHAIIIHSENKEVKKMFNLMTPDNFDVSDLLNQFKRGLCFRNVNEF